MSDRDENPGQINTRCLRFVLGTANAQAGDSTLITKHLVDDMIPFDLDLAFLFFLEQVILQDLFGT